MQRNKIDTTGSSRERESRASSQAPVTHVSVAAKSETAVAGNDDETPNLIRKMESSSCEWSVDESKHGDLVFDADSTSFLSLNSSSATSFDLLSTRRKSAGNFGAAESSDDDDNHDDNDAWTISMKSSQSSAGESVFDRLYLEGRAKLRAQRSQASSAAQPGRSSSRRSGGATSTVSSNDSVYERLYRNDNSRRRRRNEASLSLDVDDGSASLKSTNSSWQRRINYAAPMDVRSRRLRSSRNAASPSRTLSSATSSSTVFDRLHRNERTKLRKHPTESFVPKPVTPSTRIRRTATDGTPGKSLSSESPLSTPHAAQKQDFSFLSDDSDSAVSPLTLSPGRYVQAKGRNTGTPSTNYSHGALRDRNSDNMSLLAREISLLSERISEDELLVDRMVTDNSSELSMLAKEVSLVDDSFILSPSIGSPFRTKADFFEACANGGLASTQPIVNLQRCWRGYQIRRKKSNKIQTVYTTEVSDPKIGPVMITPRAEEVVPDEQTAGAIACILQRRWRTYTARKQYVELRSAIMMIQSIWRMHYQRRRFLASMDLMDSYSLSPDQFDNETDADATSFSDFSSFLLEDSNAVMIQSAYRGHIGRRKSLFCVHSTSTQGRAFLALAENEAAATIQTAWRRQKKQLSFTLQRVSAIMIQSLFRTHVHQSHYKRILYIARRNAANCIQTWWRNQLSSFSEKAVKVQAQWRAYNSRSNFVTARISTTLLQATYRAYIVRQHLRQRHCSAKEIQSTWRQHRSYCSAVRIQSAWRKNIKRETFLCTRMNAISIQSAIRLHIQRVKYAALLRAIAIIQTAWKLHHAQCVIRQQNDCAKLLQRVTRTKLAVHRYSQSRKAVLLLQTRWRKCRIKMQSAILLQKHVRGFFIRHRVAGYRRATAVICTWYRDIKHRERMSSAATIAAWWIWRVQLRKQHQVTMSAVLIQRRVRQYANQRAYAKYLVCIRMIQASFRKHRLASRFRKMRKAAHIIQTAYSNWKDASEHDTLVRHAVTMQSYWRANMEICAFRRVRLSMITIQAFARGFLCRKCRDEVRLQVVLIQAHWRAFLHSRRYERKRTAAVLLQSTIRSTKVERLFNQQVLAVIQIQSFSRMIVEYSNFARTRASCCLVQATARMFIQRRTYNQAVRSLVVLQAHVRSCRARRMIKKQRASVILIQAIHRRAIDQRLYFRKRHASVTLQAFLRCSATRATFLRERQSAIVVQSTWRGLVLLKRYCRIRATHRQQIRERFEDAVSILQKNYRGRRSRQEFYLIQHSARLIQMWFRSWHQKQQLRTRLLFDQSSTKITAWARMHTCLRNYSQARKAVVLLQSFWRRSMIQNHARELRISTIMIQSLYRRYAARRKYVGLQSCCVLLQSLQRRQIYCSHYSLLRKSTIKIQARYRLYFCRNRLRELSLAAAKIQRLWISIRYRAVYCFMRDQAIVIQSVWRRHQCCSHHRDLQNASVKIQATYRCYFYRNRFLQLSLAVAKAQRLWIATRHKAVYLFVRDQAIVIQSFLRMARDIVKTKHTRAAREVTVQRFNAAVKIQALARLTRDRHKFIHVRKQARIICQFLFVLHVNSVNRKLKSLMQILRLRCSGSLSSKAGRYALLKLRIYSEHSACKWASNLRVLEGERKTLVASTWQTTQEEIRHATCTLIQRVYRSSRRSRRSRGGNGQIGCLSANDVSKDVAPILQKMCPTSNRRETTYLALNLDESRVPCSSSSFTCTIRSKERRSMAIEEVAHQTPFEDTLALPKDVNTPTPSGSANEPRTQSESDEEHKADLLKIGRRILEESREALNGSSIREIPENADTDEHTQQVSSELRHPSMVSPSVLVCNSFDCLDTTEQVSNSTSESPTLNCNVGVQVIRRINSRRLLVEAPRVSSELSRGSTASSPVLLCNASVCPDSTDPTSNAVSRSQTMDCRVGVQVIRRINSRRLLVKNQRVVTQPRESVVSSSVQVRNAADCPVTEYMSTVSHPRPAMASSLGVQVIRRIRNQRLLVEYKTTHDGNSSRAARVLQKWFRSRSTRVNDAPLRQHESIP